MVVLRALHFRTALAAVLLVFVASCAQFSGQETGKQFVVAAAHPLAVDAGYAARWWWVVVFSVFLGSKSEKRLRSYDGRETAPAAARADRFLKEDKTPMAFVEAVVGGRSVGVPGVLRMLELAHARHGKLPWSELFQPAIAAAEGGFALSPRLQSQLARDTFLPRDAAARSIFYEGGKAKPAGASIVNRQYAETLRAIANKGVDAFYRGEIARDIVRAVRSNAKPGDLTEADLDRKSVV